MNLPPIVFAGDPHGNFTPIVRNCLALDAGTLILVGDCDCRRPLTELLAPLFAAGWDVRWILGNHDTENEHAYDNLVGAHPDGDIGLKVVEIEGLKIAGLPGVFRPRIWSGDMAEPPGFPTRRDFLASLRPDELWRGGLPLWHRDSIFPEDIDLLSSRPIDVLVCHEAPTAHPHGLDAIDTVARRTGARLVVHGHHHTSYDAMIDGAVRVRGLALAETWVMSLD